MEAATAGGKCCEMRARAARYSKRRRTSVYQRTDWRTTIWTMREAESHRTWREEEDSHDKGVGKGHGEKRVMVQLAGVGLPAVGRGRGQTSTSFWRVGGEEVVVHGVWVV
ncbi:hypothetical protein HPP92_020204 [Vanilla planifolia]|uniref:Uncharacterized protein n=1 Tax=Vanilla planifolia TaxID=51239 RepID=A0A835Q4A6_VANPL|nr:hypothetical protein HPP92_020204 [Vanilla planifolia]